MKPLPDGSKNALFILRLLEEEPHIATLPRPERVATRKKRARKAWGDFFTGFGFCLDRGKRLILATGGSMMVSKRPNES